MNKGIPSFLILAGILLTSYSVFSPNDAFAVNILLESGINGNFYNIEGVPGTAGTQGVDFELGTYLAGGNTGKGHGFKNSYGFDSGHYCTAAEPNCFVSGPPAFTDANGINFLDHNWLQGTTRPVVVDLGAGNADDRAIVFNSIDHLGVENTVYNDPEKDLWNALIEGIEFTVYATNDPVDANACATTDGAFGNTEAGAVPGAGACSSFEQGVLLFVFIDGWDDFGATNEGDDFASVWQFTQDYQYIAVYSNESDPFLLDGFRSFDNELDAIGRFIGILPGVDDIIGGEIIPIETTVLLLAAAQSPAAWLTTLTIAALGIGAYVFTRNSNDMRNIKVILRDYLDRL